MRYLEGVHWPPAAQLWNVIVACLCGILAYVALVDDFVPLSDLDPDNFTFATNRSARLKQDLVLK